MEPSPKSKKLKTHDGGGAAVDDISDARNLDTASTAETRLDKTEQRAGITQKLNAKQRKIEGKEREIEEKEREIEYLDEHNEPQRQNTLLALFMQKDSLRNELGSLQEEKQSLKEAFLSGKYFAETSDWCRATLKESTPSTQTFWQRCGRSVEDVKQIKCRHASRDSDLQIITPYHDTKAGAEDFDCRVAKSNSSRTSASTQASQAIRDKIWPTDIFGNECAGNQQIAHLIPCGKDDHKEWYPVASAVIGLNRESSVESRKKATRGFVERSGRRVAHTGVIHFVSNKIRMASQGTYFDGSNPSILLVPVMSLAEAQQWKGESYQAVFLAGLPENAPCGGSKAQPYRIFEAVGLTSFGLLTNDSVRDATPNQVEKAFETLREAVLALRSLISQMDGSYIKGLGLPEKSVRKLEEARAMALTEECSLPYCTDSISATVAIRSATKTSRTAKKPVCLVTFGGSEDKEKHPAPDPILLALKAAANWAFMTGTRLLACASEPDRGEYISEGDIIAEMEYYEAVFGSKRAETWEELAAGLGQAQGDAEE